MENENLYRIFSDKLSRVIAYVEDLTVLFKSKKESDTDTYISFLQLQIPNIEEELQNILDYLKTTLLKERVKQRFFKYSKQLNKLLFEFENELIRLNATRNNELENAFNFELDNNYTIANNELLPNYLEIEKDFRNFIKVGESQLEEKKKGKSEQNWFIIGVKFATGEIQNLLNEGMSATQIAKSLGNEEGYRPYITSSIGSEKVKTDKNIFNRKKKDLELILNYCEEKNLIICQDFKDKTKRILID